MQIRASILAITCLLAALLAGCGGGPPPSPPVCSPALDCIQLIVVQDPACTVPFGSIPSSMYQFQNNHPDTAIYVSYVQNVRHLNVNPPIPDGPPANLIVSVDPGKAVNLGCVKTKNPNPGDEIDEWSFNKTSACFAGQCGSGSSKPTPPPRDPKLTCERLCNKNDVTCFKNTLGNSNPAEVQLAKALNAFNFAILSAKPPAKVDMSSIVALSNAYTGTTHCNRDTLDLNALAPPAKNFSFYNVGSDCPAQFAISDPRASYIGISFPSELSGLADVSTKTFSLKPTDDPHSPKLTIGLLSPDGPSTEPIIEVNGGSQHLLFTGEYKYCAMLQWPN